MAKVLLIDNSSKYLKDALPFYGYETIVAKDEIQAIKYLKNNDIDIILLDDIMPNVDSIQILKNIREINQYIPIVMLTNVNDDKRMIISLKSGADDCIMKPFILPNLLARMEAILRRTLAIKKIKTVKKETLKPLTDKEKEVLELASKGNSNKQIADKLFVKEVTVKTHLNKIFKKLNVTNRTQAVLIATQKNF